MIWGIGRPFLTASAVNVFLFMNCSLNKKKKPPDVIVSQTGVYVHYTTVLVTLTFSKVKHRCVKRIKLKVFFGEKGQQKFLVLPFQSYPSNRILQTLRLRRRLSECDPGRDMTNNCKFLFNYSQWSRPKARSHQAMRQSLTLHRSF